MSNKYYVDIDSDGFDKEAYINAFKFAHKLSQQDIEVKRIVCYVHTKRNTGFFEPFFNEKLIKTLLNGNVRIEPFVVPLSIQTKVTYDRCKYSSSESDLILAFGLDSEDLEVLDDYYGVRYIVAIPWLKDNIIPWVTRWHAKEITGKEEEKKEIGVSDIVKVAFTELSSFINMSTGISHPSDNSLAKTYVRALHKYEPELDSQKVVSYLVTELGWTSAHANDVGKLIATLNEGRYYTGGDKMGLQNHYKRWKDKVNQ